MAKVRKTKKSDIVATETTNQDILEYLSMIMRVKKLSVSEVAKGLSYDSLELDTWIKNDDRDNWGADKISTLFEYISTLGLHKELVAIMLNQSPTNEFGDLDKREVDNKLFWINEVRNAKAKL